MCVMYLFQYWGGGGGGADDDGGELITEVILADGVSERSAILDCWQVDGVVLRVFNL